MANMVSELRGRYVDFAGCARYSNRVYLIHFSVLEEEMIVRSF